MLGLGFVASLATILVIRKFEIALAIHNLESSVNIKYSNMTLTNNRLLIISHLKVLHSSILTTIFITLNL